MSSGNARFFKTLLTAATAIWPWILQIGQDRAGFYSYTQLENLFGCEMRNADRIVPEWQQRQVGDVVWMTPKEKFRGVGTDGDRDPRAQPSHDPGTSARCAALARHQWRSESDLGLHP